MSNFQAQPLRGKRILVTRSSEQAGTFSKRLCELGALPIEFPTIRLLPPQQWEPLDKAFERLLAEDGCPWLVFTSANGVRFALERFQQLGNEPKILAEKTRLVSIGKTTTSRLAEYGLTPSLVPTEAVGESVAAAILKEARRQALELQRQRVILLRAEVAREAIVTELQKADLVVEDVPAYRNVPVRPDDQRGQEVLRLLQDRQLAILPFTSSSTVRNFMQWLQSCEMADFHRASLVLQSPTLKIASIGPITSQTIREWGLPVDIQARSYTLDGLIEAIVEYEEKHD